MDTHDSNRELLVQAIQQLGTKLAGFEKLLELWGEHLAHLEMAALDTEMLQKEMLIVRRQMEAMDRRITSLEILE